MLQTTVLHACFAWQRSVERIFRRIQLHEAVPPSLEDVQRQLQKQLHNLQQLAVREIGRSARITVESLIHLNTRQRDTTKHLLTANCQAVTDFEWQTLLRYDWEPDGNVLTVKQWLTTIPYGYDYVGASSPIVFAPQTEKARLGFTQLLKQFM